MATITPEHIRKQMEVAKKPGVYLLGCLERRVTLYSQQVRALNLVHALNEQINKLSEAEVCVVGGGVAGLMAAAGAAHLGAKVSLLERHPELLHLQRGNATRWLHPHIYEWPDEGSEVAWAELPFMSWQAGMAGNVARQILAGWNRVIGRYPKRITVYRNTILAGITRSSKGWRIISNSNVPGQFRYVILAIGFGLEQSSSYWRNDALDQPTLRPSGTSGENPKYLISGCGDGGLIDWLRTQLLDFRHDRIVIDFFGALPENLRRRLVDIDREVFEEAEKEGLEGAKQDEEVAGWLNDKYQEIKIPDEIEDEIKGRLRDDIDAVLNGPYLYPYSIGASRLNRFLVHCILRHRKKNYQWGRIVDEEFIAERWNVKFEFGKSTKTDTYDFFIRRHGPTSALVDLPDLSHGADSLRHRNLLDQTRKPIWKRGETFGEERGVPAPDELALYGADAMLIVQSLSAAHQQLLLAVAQASREGAPFVLSQDFRREIDPLHPILRDLRGWNLVRPAEGGRWRGGKQVVLTRFGAYALADIKDLKYLAARLPVLASVHPDNGFVMRRASSPDRECVYFSEDIVVDDASLRKMVTGGEYAFDVEWHDSINRVLAIVRDMSQNLDERLQVFPWFRDETRRHLAGLAYKKKFSELCLDLAAILKETDYAIQRLREMLVDTPEQYRIGMAKAALVFMAIRVIRYLRAFESTLIAEDRLLIVTLFPHLPRFDLPLDVFPVINAVTRKALGEGRLLSVQVGMPNPRRRRMVVPLRDAERYQGKPGEISEEVFYYWFVPQYIWFVEPKEIPKRADMEITEVADADGDERWNGKQGLPWKYKPAREMVSVWPPESSAEEIALDGGLLVRAIDLSKARSNPRKSRAVRR